MSVQKFKGDIPERLLTFLASRLPEQFNQWPAAMLGELETLHDPRERVAWAVSGIWGLGRIWIGASLRSIVFHPVRPLPVAIVSAYHAIFCGVLLYVIASQLQHITSSWTEAFFPVLFVIFAAIIPGVIALGLWVLDDSARYFAVFFSLLHGLGNYAMVSTGRLPWAARPIGRIGLDILIVGILVCHRIKRAFRPPPIRLTLDS